MATLETINTDPEVVLWFDGTYGLWYDVEPVYIWWKECGATDDLSKSLWLSDLRWHSAIYHFFGESNGLFVNAPLKESLKNGWNRYSLISPIRDGSAYGRPWFWRFYVLVQQWSQADKFLWQDPQRLFELMKLHSSTRELGVPNRRWLADIVKYLSKKGSKHLSYEQTLRPWWYLDMPDGYNWRWVWDDFINLETVRSYSSKW
jgi:hypothetical protein